MSTHVHTRASSGGVWFQVAGIISVAQSHYRESRRSRRASEREGESKDAAPYGCRVPLSAEPYIGYPHEYLCGIAPPRCLSTVEHTSTDACTRGLAIVGARARPILEYLRASA